MNKFYKFLISLLLLVGTILPSGATHMMGGDMSSQDDKLYEFNGAFTLLR